MFAQFAVEPSKKTLVIGRTPTGADAVQLAVCLTGCDVEIHK